VSVATDLSGHRVEDLLEHSVMNCFYHKSDSDLSNWSTHTYSCVDVPQLAGHIKIGASPLIFSFVYIRLLYNCEKK